MQTDPEYSQLGIPFDSNSVEEVFELAKLLFPTLQQEDFEWRINNMPLLSGFIARIDQSVVGFKLGYAVTSTRYYSWLGGVHPEHQKVGIARQLMKNQHDWLRDKGFAVVETEQIQTNHRMARLNESAGFNASGIRFDSKPRTIYRRTLDSKHKE